MALVLITVGLVVFFSGRLAGHFGASPESAFALGLNVFMFLTAINLIVEYRVKHVIKQIREIVEEIEMELKKGRKDN